MFYSAHAAEFILYTVMNSLPRIQSILGFYSKHSSVKYDVDLAVHICSSGKAADPGSVIASCMLHHRVYKT